MRLDYAMPFLSSFVICTLKYLTVLNHLGPVASCWGSRSRRRFGRAVPCAQIERTTGLTHHRLIEQHHNKEQSKHWISSASAPGRIVGPR